LVREQTWIPAPSADPETREISMKLMTTAALAIAFTCGFANCQTAINDAPGKGTNVVSKNVLFAKGGIGIINTHLYIDLRAMRNELILDDGKRWSGLEHGRPEIVVFFDNKVWMTSSVPSKFDLSKAIVVSFEGRCVRFFDFSESSGGYYRRPQQ
jgi:hypothetical protein